MSSHMEPASIEESLCLAAPAQQRNISAETDRRKGEPLNCVGEMRTFGEFVWGNRDRQGAGLGWGLRDQLDGHRDQPVSGLLLDAGYVDPVKTLQMAVGGITRPECRSRLGAPNRSGHLNRPGWGKRRCNRWRVEVERHPSTVDEDGDSWISHQRGNNMESGFTFVGSGPNQHLPLRVKCSGNDHPAVFPLGFRHAA